MNGLGKLHPSQAHSEPAPKKRITIWNIFFFLIGLALLAFLLGKIDFGELIHQVTTIQPWQLLFAGMLYLVKVLLRSYRIMRVNARSMASLNFPEMLRITTITTFISQIVPLKLGELTYVVLLKRDSRAPVAQGVSSLVVVRLFDLLAISILFIASALLMRIPGKLSIYFMAVLAFSAVLLAIILGLLIAARKGQAWIEAIFGWRILQKLPLMGKIHALLIEVLDQLRRYPVRDYGGWALIAVGEWFVNYVVFHILMNGLGIAPTFFATITAVTFSALASVLPINSFGNFGTQEAGWATGLTLLGYSTSGAIASGFATHLLTLFYMMIFASVAWASYGISARRK